MDGQAKSLLAENKPPKKQKHSGQNIVPDINKKKSIRLLVEIRQPDGFFI